MSLGSYAVASGKSGFAICFPVWPATTPACGCHAVLYSTGPELASVMAPLVQDAPSVFSPCGGLARPRGLPAVFGRRLPLVTAGGEPSSGPRSRPAVGTYLLVDSWGVPLCFSRLGCFLRGPLGYYVFPCRFSADLLGLEGPPQRRDIAAGLNGCIKVVRALVGRRRRLSV